MKFNINQSELQHALSVVSKGSSTRSTLPILSCAYLKAEEGSLTLQSTDLVLSIKMKVSALVEEPGAVALPAKLLLDIVKNLPDMAIRVETDDMAATIFCDSSTFSLKTMDPLDFPTFPEVTPEQETQFPFETFSGMVKSVAKVVSRDETRPVLTGVLIQRNGNTCRMVATDSYRLAVAEAELEGESDDFEAVVGGSFLQEIASLPISNDPVTLALSDNQIVVSYQEVTFINRRIEGTFPNYKQLIAEGFSTRATLSTQALVAATRRVSLLSSKTAPVQMRVDAQAGVVTLITNAQDVGNAQESLICDVQGESVDIAFNYSYLLDGLNSITTDAVQVDLFGSMKPGILRATEEENYLYLIMPVRL